MGLFLLMIRSASSAISFDAARHELGAPFIDEALEAILDRNFTPVI